MATKPKSFSQKFIIILTVSLKFICIVITLNYFTLKAQSVTETILDEDYFDLKGKREVFNSVNGLLCVEKMVGFFLSWGVLYWWRKIGGETGKRRHQIGEENDRPTKYSLSHRQQVMLGVLTFLITQVYLRLQSTFSVKKIINFKYMNYLLIIIVIHIVTNKQQKTIGKSFRSIKSIFIPLKLLWRFFKTLKKASMKSCCTTINLLIKKIILTFVVVYGVINVKVDVLKIPLFHQSNSAKWPDEQFSFAEFLFCFLVLGMDYLLYVGLYKMKAREEIVQADSTTPYHWPQEQVIRRKLTPMTLLNQWLKYTSLCFLLYIFLSGQMFYLISFIQRHNCMIIHLLQLSFYHFITKYITCIIIIHYQPHVFFAIMASNGAFVRASFITLKSFTMNSLSLGMIIFGLMMMMIKIIMEKIGENDGLSEVSEEEQCVQMRQKEEKSGKGGINTYASHWDCDDVRQSEEMEYQQKQMKSYIEVNESMKK